MVGEDDGAYCYRKCLFIDGGIGSWAEAVNFSYSPVSPDTCDRIQPSA
jgi:hypothetical protein